MELFAKDSNEMIDILLFIFISKYRVRLKVRISHDLDPLLTLLHHSYDLYYVSGNMSRTTPLHGDDIFIHL